MPVVVPPKVARLDIHTRPAHQQVFGFGGVVFDLGNQTATVTGSLLRAYKRRGKYTYQPANDDGQRYYPKHSAHGDLPGLSQPALHDRLFLFPFLGCDPQHKPRRRWTIICAFANSLLAYFICSTVVAQNKRGATKCVKPNGTAQRQLI